MSRELETIVAEMRAYGDRDQLPTTIVLHWADRIAALTASPQAAPEGDELSDLDVLAHWLDSQGFHGEAQNVRNGIDHDSYEDELRLIEFARNFATASPQVQGGEALGEVSDGWCGHARAVNWSNRQGPPPGTKLYASPQRAPGVTEGCAIQLSADDWNPYELLDVARRSLAADMPTVIVERIDECLRQQKQTQRAAPVSAPGVDEVRRVMPKGASLRDYLARLGCGELKPVDQMELANMLDDSIDVAVDRFLAWPLPKDFAPDCGISFDGRKDDEWNKGKTWPIGTNLLTAVQAKAMFEHCLASGPSGVDGLIDLGEHGELRNATVLGARVVCARADQVNGCTFFGVTFAQDQGEGNGC
jgi:hypothetical protein